VLRAAVDDYVSRRLTDEGFHKRMEQVMAEERQVMERMALRGAQGLREGIEDNQSSSF